MVKTVGMKQGIIYGFLKIVGSKYFCIHFKFSNIIYSGVKYE